MGQSSPTVVSITFTMSSHLDAMIAVADLVRLISREYGEATGVDYSIRLADEPKQSGPPIDTCSVCHDIILWYRRWVHEGEATMNMGREVPPGWRGHPAVPQTSDRTAPKAPHRE